MRALAFAIALLGGACVATSALAQTRVVVREFDGPMSKRARGAVVSELDAHSVELVPSAAADHAASKASANLNTPEGRVAVARELKASAFIDGHVESAGRRLRLTLTVYNGRDGGKLDEATITAPRATLPHQAGERFWKVMGTAIEKAQQPVEAEKAAPAVVTKEGASVQGSGIAFVPEKAKPEKASEPIEPASAESEPSESGPTVKRSPFDLGVGARFGTRAFTYHDPLSGVRDYALGLSPNIALHVHYYPWASSANGFAGNLGLDLRGELMVGVSSTNSTGDKFSSSSLGLGAGVRLRLPIAKNELGLLVGVGEQTFGLTGDKKGVVSGVPDATHGFARTGADAHIRLSGPLTLELEAAYLWSLGYGEIKDKTWFPHTTGGGIEAELGLGLDLFAGLSLQATGVLSRYFMTFDPRPTDSSAMIQHRVAGGAVDQYLSLRIGAVWRM